MNWLGSDNNRNFDTGFAAGGIVGYDLGGPRFELETQAIADMSWNVDRQFRVSLDARYHGTTSGSDLLFQNDDITTMLTVAYRFQ